MDPWSQVNGLEADSMAESERFGDMKMNGPKVYVRTTVQFRPFGPNRYQDRSFSIVHFQPPYCSLWTLPSWGRKRMTHMV